MTINLKDGNYGTIGKPGKPKWKNCLERVEENRSFLHIHGFLSDSENEKMRKRVLKWCKKYGVNVREKSIFED